MWTNYVKHIEKIEESYWDLQPVFDNQDETCFIFDLQSSSEDENNTSGTHTDTE